MRSLATRSRRSASSSKISRTLPLATWTAVSGMNGFLLAGCEGVEAFEKYVDVLERVVEVEGAVEGVGRQGDVGIRLEKIPQRYAFLPRAHGVSLDDPVGVVALKPGLDQGEEHPLAADEPVRGLEIGTHPLRADHEAFDEPVEAVE